MPPNSTPFISVLRTLSQSTTRLSLRHHPLFKSLPKYPQRTPQRLIHTSTPLRNFEQPLETSPKTHQPRPSPPKPEYQLTFTCDPCGTRSTHKVSKQGYHHGSVLIQCPQCKNRHVMSDHLNMFGDRKMTIEDLMKERGEMVKKGTLSEDGDVEFWDDGTQTMAKRDGVSGVKAQAQLGDSTTATEAKN